MKNDELLHSLESKQKRIAVDISLIKEIDGKFDLSILEVAPIDMRYAIHNFNIEDYLDVMDYEIHKSGNNNVVISVWCHLPFKSIEGYDKVKFRLMVKNLCKVNPLSVNWSVGENSNEIKLIYHLKDDPKFISQAAKNIVKLMVNRNNMKIGNEFPIHVREKIIQLMNFS